MKKKKSTQPTGVLERAGKLLKLAGSLTRQEVAHRLGDRDAGGSAITRLKQAATLVQELSHMKGAAMKVGQMLALEARDYLPDEVVQVLEQLQNKASFMAFDEVDEILRSDLGKKRSQLRELSEEPIAAASIGQVHRAEIEKNGTMVPVAVKVQYPGIRDSIHSDVKILGVVLKGLTTVFRREIEIEGLLEEFAEVFVQETDYEQEAQAAIDYRKAAATLAGVVVPRVHLGLSTARVLTMDYEPGLTLTQWIRQTHPTPARRLELGALILELYSREFCEWGLVQTDPNPGNFLIRPETGELILLDFGATKRYSKEFRIQYSRLIMAIFTKDTNKVMDAALKMALLDPRESAAAQKAFQALVFESMRPIALNRFDFTDQEHVQKVRTLSQNLLKELRFSAPPKDLIFLHRKLGGVYQMLRQLEVDLELGSYLSRFEELSTQ